MASSCIFLQRIAPTGSTHQKVRPATDRPAVGRSLKTLRVEATAGRPSAARASALFWAFSRAGPQQSALQEAGRKEIGRGEHHRPTGHHRPSLASQRLVRVVDALLHHFLQRAPPLAHVRLQDLHIPRALQLTLKPKAKRCRASTHRSKVSFRW